MEMSIVIVLRHREVGRTDYGLPTTSTTSRELAPVRVRVRYCVASRFARDYPRRTLRTYISSDYCHMTLRALQVSKYGTSTRAQTILPTSRAYDSSTRNQIVHLNESQKNTLN
eukprot:scaffold618419_cov20-Prasinocladus_malaysianus.AAC.1